MLHQTDLHERLTAALDGPQAWIRWDLARAIARNVKFKLEEPPQRTIATQFWARLQEEAASFVRHFPSLPPDWLTGERIDDPTVRYYRGFLAAPNSRWRDGVYIVSCLHSTPVLYTCFS